eukprot:12815079-Alexandrium_andersonii.AAC.1
MNMWSSIERILEFAGDVADRSVRSPGSLPQGCPAAVIGMSTILLFPTTRILNKIPRALIAVYADDRNALASSEGQMS